MGVYLVLFGVVWFFSIKTTGDASAPSSAVVDETHHELLRDHHADLVAQYGADNVLPEKERTISNVVQSFRASRSFATYNEAATDGTDEMSNIRSLSVA